MIEWKSVIEFSPPKDRVIIVTSGASWHRQDEVVPARSVKGAIVPGRHVKRLLGRGGVALVYWRDKVFGMEGGRWLTLDGGFGPQDFRYWAEFNNPIDETAVPIGYSVDVMTPDVEELKPIE